MRYERERRSFRTPTMIVLTGLGLAIVGFVSIFFSVYLAGMLAGSGGGGTGALTIGSLLADPLVSVFEGGIYTFGGGWLLMIVGGVSCLLA